MDIEIKKNLCSNWFAELRDMICCEFEKIEEEYFKNNANNLDQDFSSLSNLSERSDIEKNNFAKFVKKKWQRNDQDRDGGYGEMSIMKGRVFEKVGVNFSKVYGEFSEEFRKEIPGANQNPKFWASGISLVAHMSSPLVPAVHMNTRFICTQKHWFGGGSDLNPIFEEQKDTDDFHQEFKDRCDRYNLDYYPKFKKWCDEYFFIKHRGVARGVGGVFYDYLNNGDDQENFTKDFNFTKDIGLGFLEIFPKLVRRNMFKKYNQTQRYQQLKKRGLYTEFNLVYDRGTKFGLMTNGNAEAILMSLPPIAIWE